MKSASPHSIYFIFRYFLFSVLFIFSIAGCSSTSRFNNDRKSNTRHTRLNEKSGLQVRVLLDQISSQNNFSFNNKVILKDGNDEIASLDNNEKFLVYTENENLYLKMNRNNFKVHELNIIPAGENNNLEFKGKSYPGYIKISNANTRISVINIAGLEEYVTSVVFSEFGTKFGENEIEAIKAFSVCVRNYTLAKLNENKNSYDLYSDVRDQLYKGSLHAPAILENAVQQTKGEVLKYNGELATVFYHSSCGGYTEDCSNVFSTKSRPYLEGVKDGDTPYCKISPGFNWTEEYTGKELASLLTNAGYLDKNFYHITSIEIKDKFKSGRNNRIQITASSEDGADKNINLDGYAIRNVIKSKKTNGILRSSFFDIDPVYKNGELEKVTITGRGYGHGVGFCQWGAIAQSRTGKNYQEILSFYFPGTHLENLK